MLICCAYISILLDLVYIFIYFLSLYFKTLLRRVLAGIYIIYIGTVLRLLKKKPSAGVNLVHILFDRVCCNPCYFLSSIVSAQLFIFSVTAWIQECGNLSVLGGGCGRALKFLCSQPYLCLTFL